jgi:hypothetical protein
MDTESVPALTTKELRRHGLLHPDTSTHLTLTWPATWWVPSVSVAIEAGPVDHLLLAGHGERQIVRLSSTAPHYGGVRWWLHCPLCDRRCAVLFLVDERFACRQCQDLTYRIWRETRIQRVTRKAWKIQRRLGAPTDQLHSCWLVPPKPNGMHDRTYQRLTAELYALLPQVFTAGRRPIR